jgi:hypothetical protein
MLEFGDDGVLEVTYERACGINNLVILAFRQPDE